MKDERFQTGQHANICGYENDFEIRNLLGANLTLRIFGLSIERAGGCRTLLKKITNAYIDACGLCGTTSA